MSTSDLENLVERARQIEMTRSEKEEQRKSFAYGNANIENDAVTREVVELAAAQIAQGGGTADA